MAKTLLISSLVWAFVLAPPVISQGTPPQNLIVLIADGAGPASFTLARDFKRFALGEDGLSIDPYLRGSVGTSPAIERYPDSGAAAAAYASGIKTRARTVGVDTAGKPVGTLIEAAEIKGLWTGLISTSALPDATPAAFSAHTTDRYDYTGTVPQQIRQNIELLFGGGRKYFEPESIGGERTDRINQVEVARRLGYQVVSNRTELLSDLQLPLLGLFAPNHMSYEIDKDGTTEPTLQEMTTIAIGMLSRSETGFILVVETEGTDDAGHSNEPAAMLREILAFDASAKVALDFAESDGNTLVVILSDHDTGGLSIGGGEADWNPESMLRITSSVSAFAEELRIKLVEQQPAQEIVQYAREAIRRRFDIHDLLPEYVTLLVESIEAASNSTYQPGMLDGISDVILDIISDRASIGWETRGHTNVDVNMYAFGPRSDWFSGHMENAEVGRNLALAMGLDLSEVTSRLRSTIPDSAQ